MFAEVLAWSHPGNSYMDTFKSSGDVLDYAQNILSLAVNRSYRSQLCQRIITYKPGALFVSQEYSKSRNIVHFGSRYCFIFLTYYIEGLVADQSFGHTKGNFCAVWHTAVKTMHKEGSDPLRGFLSPRVMAAWDEDARLVAGYTGRHAYDPVPSCCSSTPWGLQWSGARQQDRVHLPSLLSRREPSDAVESVARDRWLLIPRGCDESQISQRDVLASSDDEVIEQRNSEHPPR